MRPPSAGGAKGERSVKVHYRRHVRTVTCATCGRGRVYRRRSFPAFFLDGAGPVQDHAMKNRKRPHRDAAALRAHPGLAPLRDDTRFTQLLVEMEKPE